MCVTTVSTHSKSTCVQLKFLTHTHEWDNQFVGVHPRNTSLLMGAGHNYDDPFKGSCCIT